MNTLERLNELRQMKMRTQDFATAFHRHCTRKDLGCVSDAYKAFRKEYADDGDEHLTAWCVYYFNHVRTEQYLKDLAKTVVQVENLPFSPQEMFDYYIWEVIINTYDGFSKERELKRMIENSGWTVSYSTGNDDAELSIDLIVEDICLLQLKPVTYLFGNNNQSLLIDRRTAFKKEQMAEETYNLPLYYVFYDKTNFKKQNGHMCFRLEDLINVDGTTKGYIKFD